MRQNKISIILCLIAFSSVSYAQFEFEDDFDEYVTGGQLACQNPFDWTTWSNFPCSWEDPFINNNFFFSGPNSVLIESYNDLVKPLGNFSTGRNHTTFYVYIPSGKTGYFSLLSKFIPDSNEVAFECYFDESGIGRLMMIPGEPVLFDYTNNQWHRVWVVVDFFYDEAEFWFDGTLIHSWEWTQNGTLTSQLAAHNFWGISPSSEMYIDDYYLFPRNCLFCYPPDAPSNFVAEVRFTPDTLVELNWRMNVTIGFPYGSKIIRKNGLPNNSVPYEIIGTTLSLDSTYIDTNVLLDSTYTYGVMAFNVFGNSDTSNTATVTIDPITSILYSNSISAYSLSQNYPNPFNPTTTVKYQIPELSYATLTVYDVLGNEVATLVNEEKSVGNYEVEFDGANLPSGVYFYRLTAAKFSDTKKLILLK